MIPEKNQKEFGLWLMSYIASQNIFRFKNIYTPLDAIAFLESYPEEMSQGVILAYLREKGIDAYAEPCLSNSKDYFFFVYHKLGTHRRMAHNSNDESSIAPDYNTALKQAIEKAWELI